jgi:hypothetical protein
MGRCLDLHTDQGLFRVIIIIFEQIGFVICLKKYPTVASVTKMVFVFVEDKNIPRFRILCPLTFF